MNLTISKKLFLSFGVIIIMIVILGIYSFFIMKSMDNRSKELNSIWISGLDLAHSIETEVTIHKAREYKYITEEDNEKKNNIQKSIEQNKDNFSKLMNQYLKTTVLEYDKELASIVQAEYNKFIEISDEVIALNSQGKYSEAKELAFGTGLQQYNSLMDAANDLVKYNQENSVRVNLENTNAFERASILLIITTLIIVLTSTCISLLIGNNLSKRIKLSTKIMKKTAAFDLSLNQSETDSYMKFKSNDELTELIQYINQARLEIRNLVQLVNEGSNGVALRSNDMSEVIKETANSIEEVAKATDELALGITDLATNAQNGVEKLKSLSEQIDEVSNISDFINESLEKTDTSNKEGISCIEDLQISISENINVAERMSEQINILDTHSSLIGKITDTINSITSQINLLSLNAAIEAARAGEQGRGFTIVSEEIRKLADETAKSNKQIENIIVSIQTEINKAKAFMQNAKTVIEKTEISSKRTQTAFTVINSSVKNIIEHMSLLLSNIKKIDIDKNHALNSIEEISAIAQESASSTEEISAYVEQQSASLGEISYASNELKNISLELDKNINKFKL